MNASEWEEVQILFFEALEQNPTHRLLFVKQRCSSKNVYEAVVEMLLADQELPQYLKDPPDWLNFISPAIGSLIGLYQIIQEIGRGGMGRVYLAKNIETGDSVALKMINPAFTGPDTLKRFLLEQRVMARLDHPNIARLIEVGFVDDQVPFLVMEYIKGMHVVDFCETNNLSYHQRLLFFLEVCHAIQHAHQNRIVHRDLKPSNILVTKDKKVKVLDFGIAKLLEDDALVITRTGQKVLTPAYAAPEQMMGLPVTGATDIYMLGALLHEILVGKRPTDSDQGENLPDDIQTVIVTCMKKEPGARYSSVSKLIEAIDRLIVSD